MRLLIRPENARRVIIIQGRFQKGVRFYLLELLLQEAAFVLRCKSWPVTFLVFRSHNWGRCSPVEFL